MATFVPKPSTALCALVPLVASLLCAASALAQDPIQELEAELSTTEDPLFEVDTPVGPLSYALGRGLSVGNTGLHVGGFTTLELDREDGKPGELELDALNFLVLLEPNDYVRAFMELEIGDLFVWKTNSRDVDSNPTSQFKRLYMDLIISEALVLRGGKFQTPIGRWNLVPAEPFVWTAEAPAFFEVAFEEHQTGGSVQGSTHPFGGTLDYWVYGQFIKALDPEGDPEPADHSVGGRLQFGRAVQQWSVGTSFLATEIGGQWSYLGGIDAELRFGPLLLTSEAMVEQGAIGERDLWDYYVQGVLDVFPTFHLVARYERIDRKGRSEDAHIGDFGIAWIPKPYIHLRTSYRVTDKQTEEVRRGLSVSLSFIF
jgi:hypothetical protein